MTLFKKISHVVFSAIIILASAMSFAGERGVKLVLDARNNQQLPNHFREDKSLMIAGGAQFSELSLKKIREELRAQHMTVIDLREESHGFLDGNAISWYGPEDAANANKSPAEINKDQQAKLASLMKHHRVKVNRIIKKSDDGEILQTQPVEFVARSVASEEELVKKHDMRYRRIYVQDFHAPADDETDRFIQIVKKLPKKQWIYFHCRAGVGRTTTFMTMFDMMQHAKTMSFTDILARQKTIGGKDLTEMPEKRSFKYQAAEERLVFLKRFYEYAKDNNDDFETPWMVWIRSH